jgi:hypothetical protein
MRLVAELNERATQAEVSPYDFAELYAGLGDTKKALMHLQRAVALRVPEVYSIRCEPLLRGSKETPEFRELLQALGLADNSAEEQVATRTRRPSPGDPRP